jgi:type II secretory pathway component GspD/PulD (secretin)
MPRGITFASLLCAGVLAHAAFGAGPARPELRTAAYAVAGLVVPADNRPITITIGPEVKVSRPRKKLKTTQDQLIRRITEAVAPGSWGGQCKIEYRANNMSLVVTHAPAVLEQVADLLEGLRRRQEVNICLEVRLVSVSEETFERIGVDFEPKEGAFLNQQGFRNVMETAQGDRHTTIMQAPKVTCIDRQRVNFRLAVDSHHVVLSVTPAVSADRRSVRLNLRLRRDCTEDKKARAVLADGCSIMLPGWSVQRVAAQETAVPVLRRIPYVNRLFRTVGYAHESEKVFLVVTPRVIVRQEGAE